MPDFAAYMGAVSIGFVVLTTAVMLWFAFGAEDAPETMDRETDGDADAETTE